MVSGTMPAGATLSDTLWIRGYTPDGFQISLTLVVSSVQNALALIEQVRAAGITPREPGVNPGENKETIVTVVRRVKESDGTPIVDLYPAWKGEYGKFRFCGMYLNTPADIAEFEAQSGLKLDSLPLYESQAPLQRTFGKVHPKEVACKPFDAIKMEDGEKEINGKVQMTYKFERYANPTAPATGSEPDKPATTKASNKTAEGLQATIVRVERFDYTKDGKQRAAYNLYRADGTLVKHWGSVDDLAPGGIERMPFSVPGARVDVAPFIITYKDNEGKDPTFLGVVGKAESQEAGW